MVKWDSKGYRQVQQANRNTVYFGCLQPFFQKNFHFIIVEFGTFKVAKSYET